MNESTVTVSGNVVADPVEHVTSNGLGFTTFRVASTERRFNPKLGMFADGHTNFFNVTAFRLLAANAAVSLKKGQPVVVQGRLRINTYDRQDGGVGVSVDITADHIGHDLTWGRTSFVRFTGSPRDLGTPEPEADPTGDETVDVRPFDPSTDPYVVDDELSDDAVDAGPESGDNGTENDVDVSQRSVA